MLPDAPSAIVALLSDLRERNSASARVFLRRDNQGPLIVQDQLDAFFFDRATGSAIIDVRVS